MLFNNISKSSLSVKACEYELTFEALAMQGIGETTSFQFVFIFCFVA